MKFIWVVGWLCAIGLSLYSYEALQFGYLACTAVLLGLFLARYHGPLKAQVVHLSWLGPLLSSLGNPAWLEGGSAVVGAVLKMPTGSATIIYEGVLEALWFAWFLSGYGMLIYLTLAGFQWSLLHRNDPDPEVRLPVRGWWIMSLLIGIRTLLVYRLLNPR